MKKVWGLGSACVDIRLTTEDYGPGYTAKLLAKEVRMQGGGACANCLAQVTRLGGTAGWLGKLGTDPIGRQILAQFEQEQVDVSHVLVDEQALSPFNVAVYAGEQWRRVGGFLLPNCLRGWSDEDLNVLCGPVEAGDIVYCEIGEIPLECCETFLKRARSKGAVIMIDVDLDPIRQCGESEEQVRRLFELCDYLLPNTEAMESLCGTTDAETVLRQLQQAFDAAVIVTAGSRGAYLMQNEQLINISAQPVTPVDSVGAGDAFHGGFAYGLSMEWPLEKAVELGCICGAHNCLTFGARDGMLRAEELSAKGEWPK